MRPDVSTIFDGLSPYYSLLKEVLESGEHFVADKLVYVPYLRRGDDDPLCFVTKLHTHLDRWLEVHIRLRGEREPHYVAIIRPARKGMHVGWKSYGYLGLDAVHRDAPMLVNIPEPMQFPEFGSLVGVPVAIWLKRFDDRDCFRRNALNGFVELSPTRSVVEWHDGKGRAIVAYPARDTSEGASEVVQRSPEAAQKIAQDEADMGGQRISSYLYDVLASFKIILREYTVGIAYQQPRKLNIESIEVFLRPTHLQAGVSVRQKV